MAELLHKVPHLRGKFSPFGRRHPLASQALCLDPSEGKELPQELHPPICRVITIQVMAVPQVSPPHEYAVRPLLESEQHMMG